MQVETKGADRYAQKNFPWWREKEGGFFQEELVPKFVGNSDRAFLVLDKTRLDAVGCAMYHLRNELGFQVDRSTPTTAMLVPII